MTDTVRTRSALAGLLADNATGDISPQDLRDLLASLLVISSGAGAPSSAPASLFERYFDTTNKIWYSAIGTSSASDWVSGYVIQGLPTAPSASASATTFAAKGIVYDTSRDIRIRGIYANIGSSTSSTYKLVLAALSGDTISSILDVGSSVATSSAGTFWLPCSATISIPAGTRIAFILVRTDGTSTSVNQVQSASLSGSSDLVLTYYCGIRYASNSPAIGDNVNAGNISSVFNIVYIISI